MARVSRQWFDDFVTESRGELTGFLNRMLRSPDDALEVSQEAYLKVFLALRKHEDKDHCPKALLYKTARNLAISRLRHEQVVHRSMLAVTVSQELQTERRTPEQQASKSEDIRALFFVINQLPRKCRKVMLLRMLHGLSQKEIAERLDIAVSTVEKHIAKGLHRCRDAMQETLPADADRRESKRALNGLAP